MERVLELDEELLKMGLMLEIFWIPSHEKKDGTKEGEKKWGSPSMWNDASCRAINKSADTCCGKELKDAWEKLGGEEFLAREKKLNSITKGMLKHRSKGLGDFWDRICDPEDRERREKYRRFRAAASADPTLGKDTTRDKTKKA